MKIESIVKVDIKRETSSKTVRDLQTPAILSYHTRFAESYRLYEDTDSMLSDGFVVTDFAFIAAQRTFSQNPQVKQIVVGKLTTPAASANYVTEINSLLSYYSKWFFLITDAPSDTQKIAIAEFIETQDLIYVTRDSNAATLSDATTDLCSKLSDMSLNHTIVLYRKNSAEVAPEAAYVGRFASAVIGSNLWGYKSLATLVADNFTSTEISYLKAKNAQFYTTIGEDDAVAGNMKMVGGEMIHVMLGAIWLKVRIGERYWNLLYTNDRILYTNAGIDLFKAVLYEVLKEAVKNNILTEDTPFQIIVPDANTLSSQVRASGILSGITFSARLAGAIIYVDGVVGTVYP